LAPHAKDPLRLSSDVVAPQSNQAITLIFGAAAAAVFAAAFALEFAGSAAAGTGRAPMSCCSELNKRLNRFCVEPNGADALPVELGEGSNGDVFL
jgi:hypothetical protein